MTAIPADTGQTLTLVCDECGHSVPGIASTLHTWDVVWALVVRQGWTGAHMSIGPHRCPACARGDGADPAAVTAAVPAGEPLPAEPRVWRAELRDRNGTGVVTLHGDLDIAVAHELADTLRQAGDNHRDLVLDLSDVRLIDSSALSLLVRAHQQAKSRSGVVCLLAPSRFVRTVLRTMRLYDVFPAFERFDQVVGWLAARAPDGGR